MQEKDGGEVAREEGRKREEKIFARNEKAVSVR